MLDSARRLLVFARVSLGPLLTLVAHLPLAAPLVKYGCRRRRRHQYPLSPPSAAEIVTHSRLQHDNVISFLGCCFAPPKLYLLCAFAERGDLLSLLLRSSDGALMWSDRRMVRILWGIAVGLEYLHEQQLMHR